MGEAAIEGGKSTGVRGNGKSEVGREKAIEKKRTMKRKRRTGERIGKEERKGERRGGRLSRAERDPLSLL